MYSTTRILLLLFLIPLVLSECSSSEDCNGVERCISNQCRKLELLDNIDGLLIVGTLIVFFGAMLAAGGGLGGGGIFVPVFILIVGLNPKEAVPLSQATIFGGSIVNMVMNYPLKNDMIPTRPLIDYNAVLMLTPMLLAGTIIGVLLNTIFPSWLIVVSLAITLGYATRRTIGKGLTAWKNESIERKKELEPESIEMTELKEQSTDDEKESNEFLDQLLYSEDHPWIQMVCIFIVWIVVSVFSIIRGGGSTDSVIGVSICSDVYWILTAISFVVLLVFTAAIGWYLLRRNLKKHEYDWKPIQGEIDWNSRNTRVYPLFAMIAGLLGGLLGIGGGMILGPLLLEIGMKSKAVATTSAAAVFLTASSAVVQFVVLDALLYDYAIWFFGFGLIATFVGQTLINYLVKKYKRGSFIVISIAAVIALATVMLVISGVIKTIEDAENGTLGFVSLCN